jgi:hypothetical protein
MARSDFPLPKDDKPDPGGDLDLEDKAEVGAAVDEEASKASKKADPEKEDERLQMFSSVLTTRRNEWIRARAAEGLDSRWLEDVDQFNGEDTTNKMAANMMVSVEQGFPVTTKQSTPNRSTVFVQITRQKTNAAVARLGDILLPTEERNFSIGPTPLPSMPAWVTTQLPPLHVPPAPEQGAESGGNAQGGPAPTGMASVPGASMGPAAPGSPAAAPGAGAAFSNPDPGGQQDPYQARLYAEQAEAKKRSDLMQNKIEDCLDQSDYNAECRRVLYDAGVLGTGVIKGPVVLSTSRKAWKRSTDAMGKPVWMLDVKTTLAPASFRVDPRMVYPDPACGDRLQDGRGIFELQQATSKQVRDLRKQPGYIVSQLAKVLAETPKRTTEMRPLSDSMRNKRDLAAGDLWDHWVYWGEIAREDLKVAGVDLSVLGAPGMADDELAAVSACVEMINDTVVRAYLNPLPDGQLPYDFFQWEQRPGSIWGYGVPYLMRSQQRVVNAAWRMILDNAGVSAGPQIVIKPGLITPADQQWTLTSRKIWYATDDVEDVSKAFATFQFDTHQQELSAIVEMAERLSDAETAVPQMAQGERGNSPETLGGMQMLMQSANVVLKRLVKQYDDQITKPHIRRYYDYLMEYDDDDQLKGDYQVVALGSSSLVVRDIQNQALTQMLQLASNPVYAPLINSKMLFMKALRAQHLDPTDVMNTDAEIAAIKQAQAQAAQQNPSDPRVAAAQMRSQADMQRTQAQTKVAEETLQSKERIAQAEQHIKLQTLEMQRDIETLRVAQQERISVQQVKAQLAAVALKEQTKAELNAQDVQRKALEAQQPQGDGGAQAAADAQQAEQDRLHQAGMQAMQQSHDAAQAEADRNHQAALQRLQGRQAIQLAKAKPKPPAKGK